MLVNNKSLKNIWPMIALTYGGLFTLGLIDNLRGPFFPTILNHFGINSQTGSFLFAPSSFAALITCMLAPRWLNFLGARKSMYFSLSFMGIGSLLFGLTPLLTATFWPMVIGSVTFGIGNGICSICVNILLGQVAPVSYRPRLFSGLHSMYGVASLLAPLIATLFGPRLWPHAFLFSMAPALFFLILALFTVHEKDTPPSSSYEERKSLPFFTGLIYPCSLLAIYVCAEVLLSTRLAQYLEQGLKWNYEKAIAYNFYFFLSLTAGRILTTFVTFKLNNQRMLFLSLITSLICFSIGLRYPIAFLFTGFFMSYFFPLNMDTITERFKEDAPAYITKALTMGGTLLSGMHYFVGLITDRLGITFALLPGPVLLAIALIIFWKYEHSNIKPKSKGSV